MTQEMLQAAIDKFNELTSESLYVVHLYWRTAYPYSLRSSDRQEIMRGTKSELYNFLTGAILGINTYKANKNL